jgi:peptidoglycan/LPS O-acetylase OafA/YrhL
MHADSRNLWLDLIRGSSALLVCLGHLRNAMLVDYSALIHPNIAIKVFYVLTSLGHQAVMVFFVLSGYFVGGAVLRSKAQFSWGNYLTTRLTRLWVVLMPCLFITWAVGLIIAYYAPSVLTGVNVDSWHSGPKLGEYSTSFNTLLANIFFMQTIAAPVFGLNSPLWSLANEFWYYLLFPLTLAFVGVLKPSSYLTRIVTFILVVILLLCLPKDMLLSFLIWMMGVGVYVAQPQIKLLSQNTVRFLSLIALILFGLILVYSKSSDWLDAMSFESDIAIGITFAFLCLMLSNLSFPAMRFPWLAMSSLHLSEISYSLYLSHFPIVILIASTAYASHKFVPNALMLSQFLGWSLLLLIFASALWWLFESRTTFVRNKVKELLSLNMTNLKWS